MNKEIQFSNNGNFDPKKDCPKCGNPLLMFTCDDCGTSQEVHTCDECGVNLQPDKDYHEDCN